MEQNREKIKGGNVYYTESSDCSYRVTKGEMLVYIVPRREGKNGRRILLGSFGTDKEIPGFYEKRPDGVEWRFVFIALDEAEFETGLDSFSDEKITDFASSAGLFMETSDDKDVKKAFVEAVIERYELKMVKDDVYMYAISKERLRTRERLKDIVIDVFDNSSAADKTDDLTETGNPLYDAMTFMCSHLKMDIAPIEQIRTCSGRRFDIKDIARVSHFAVREIVLEGKWYRQDCGTFLAFTEKDQSPVVCVPNGPCSYLLYDPVTGRKKKVNAKVAAGLKVNAYMAYPPFPKKKLNVFDVIGFGMRQVYTSDIVRLLLLALVGTLTGLLIPYMNEQAYDKFIPMGNTPALLQIGAILLACSMGNVVFTIVKNFATFRSMNSMKYAVQSAAFDRLFNLPESFYRDYDSADLGQRAMGLATVYSVLTNGIMDTIFSSLFSLLYLIRMHEYSKDLTQTAVLMTFAVVILLIVMARFHIKYEKKQVKTDIEAGSRLFQFVSGISKIRISGTEDRALLRYTEKMVSSQQTNEKKQRLFNMVTTITQSAPLLFSMVLYYMMIDKKVNLSIGKFSAFMAAFGSFSTAMLTIASQLFNVNQVIPAYDNAKPILDALPENSEEAKVPGELRGEIEVDNVTFAYSPNREPIIKNFSLHVNPGEYVAIVGASGCGKSTLLKLLLGFEKAQIGKIYYDNKDIDELDKRELRKKFGVVLQEGGLLSGSIRDNITITSPFVDMKRVEETIDEVGLADDIRRMPMGIHTVISEGAGTISGGQRQRILIARAIVGKPRIIFLDEATSALDNMTQRQVVETLEGLDATKVVIAHRLSTIKDCDRIIVMDKGTIAEQGSYDELMAKKGMFYELAKRQIS